MKELSRAVTLSESGKYNIVEALICGKEYDGADTAIVFGETFDGHYIGEPKDAAYLCDELKIKPEPRTENSNVCSIGLSEDGKWYGWSHRALFGFEIGSTVKFGDCGYRPDSKADYEQSELQFWGEDEYLLNPRIERNDTGFSIVATYSDDVLNEKMRGTEYRHECTYPEIYGKGEWTAKTIEDARQMACDFAESVS